MFGRTGESNPRFGITHTEETKALISEAMSGENNSIYGKNHSAETLLKISEANGSKIQVINKETDETIIYSSNCKAAEALGCSETTIRNYIKNKKVYKGKFLFLHNILFNKPLLHLIGFYSYSKLLHGYRIEFRMHVTQHLKDPFGFGFLHKERSN